MKKLLVRLVLLPILLVVAVFALSNREPVSLSLWPLPWEADAPLFLLLLATLLLGVLIGAVLIWSGGHSRRVAARQHRRSSERLQRQVDALKTRGSVATPTAVTVLPPAANAPLGSERGIQPPPSFTPINRAR